MNYVLIKGQQGPSAVSTKLTLATFIPEGKINQLQRWRFSHQSLQYSDYVNRKLTPCVPIWHLINYIKGCRYCDVWAVDGVISSDKTLIKYFKANYCGIIDSEDLALIEAYVKTRIKMNGIKSVRGKLSRSFTHIDPDELSLLNNHLDFRDVALSNSLGSPSSYLRRNV